MRYTVILLLVFMSKFVLMAQVDKTTPAERPKTIDKTTPVERSKTIDRKTTIDKTTDIDKTKLRGRTSRTVDKTTPNIISRPGLILKWSPSPLLSFTAPAIQFSVEYPIGRTTEHFYLEHDVAYVYSDPEFTAANAGFRFGTRIKYYLRPVTSHVNNFFVSVMARHTQRHEKGRTFFDRGGGAYQQLLDYRQINNYNSGYLELGYLTRFGMDERVTFEIFGGGGLHYVTDKFKGIPDDAEFNDFDNTFSIPRETLLPTIIMVMKFGYILK